jgi:Putative phage tail protein
MWFEIALGLYMIGSYIYHRWIEDQPQGPTPPQINVPQVAEGTPLPLLYGRCRVRAPVLVWSGNYLHPGQTFTRMFDSSTQTADHFSLDAFFVLGVPFYGGGGGTLFNGWAGDTGLNVATVTSITGQPFLAGDLSSSTTFSIAGICPPGSAGQDAANGAPVTTTVTYQDGVSYSVATDLAGALFQNGDNINDFSGFRNQMCMYAHIALGLTPDIPSLSWEVVTTSRGSASDMGVLWPVAGDADPAAVLYDLLTSPWGKLGIPTSKIEISTFQAASATLFSEGHGYSRAIEQAEDANAIIQDILKQIDAVMYPEPATGKIELHLVRNDYVPANLQDINPSNAVLDEYTVQSWSEMPSQVRVIWTDPTANYGDAVAIGQNGSAAIAAGNRLRSVTRQYKGCRSVTLAQSLASRELAVASRPLAKANVTCLRAFYQARPGSVYTLTWPELGIDHMVMRVAQVNLGQLHRNEIKLALIRDVFDTKIGAFPPA